MNAVELLGTLGDFGGLQRTLGTVGTAVNWIVQLGTMVTQMGLWKTVWDCIDCRVVVVRSSRSHTEVIGCGRA